MPVKPLLELAQQAAMRSAKEIDDFGEIPYKLVKPVIAKIENPHQLHTIESNSPEFRGENNDKWLEFIKRDVPDWDQKNCHPKDGKAWYRVYRKLRRQAEKEAEESAKMLTAQLSEVTALKAEDVTCIDRNMQHSDRMVKKPVAAISSWRKGPSYNHQRMITPTHSLNHSPKQIVHAPPSFVEEAKRKILPQGVADGRRQASSTAARIPTLSHPSNLTRPSSTSSAPVPRPRPVGSSLHRNRSQSSLSQREARLRALTSGRADNTYQERSVSASSRQEANKTRRANDFTLNDNSSGSIKHPAPVSAGPSDSNVDDPPLPPPRTPRRIKDEDQDDSSPEEVKRRRIERVASSKTPKELKHDLPSNAETLRRTGERTSSNARKHVNEAHQTHPIDNTPKASRASPGPLRPRSRPSPLQPLMRKKRPVPT